MGKIRISSTTNKIFLCAVLFIAVTEFAFAQVPYLLLDSTDVRIEHAVFNGAVIGYNLFVRKKTGMESVMLTEPNGYYALRSMEWNAINGGERREFYGAAINDANSQFSILSSTPVPDLYFGYAFWLFVPQNVMYGNPSAPTGTVVMRINSGFQINIRTFDHKYADPTWGRYQNNQFIISYASFYEASPYQRTVPSAAVSPLDSSDHQYDELRRILISIIKINENLVYIGNNDALHEFLWDAFNRRR